MKIIRIEIEIDDKAVQAEDTFEGYKEWAKHDHGEDVVDWDGIYIVMAVDNFCSGDHADFVKNTVIEVR